MTVAPLSLEEIQAERARRSEGRTLQQDADRLAGDFRAFVREGWHVLEPGTRFRANWHIDAICEHLEDAREGRIRRLLINIPPRHMKSLTVSVFWPAWRWTFEPEARFLTFSYGQELANRDATKSRDLIRSTWYQIRWPEVILKGDVNRTSRYENTMTGHRIASHVAGGTGEGGDVILVDDPHNAEEALSDVDRAKVIRWHSNTVATRFNDIRTGVEVVIMQRLHEGDLAGHILEQEGWTHLCLPARYWPTHPFVWPDDPRTEPEELLWPEHMPGVELNRLQAGMTASDVAGQFQQLPAPREGGLLKRADWQYYDRELSYYASQSSGLFTVEKVAQLEKKVGRFNRIVHYWDTSLKDKAKSDFVAGQVWGAVGAHRYLLRLWKQRAGFNATVEAMDELGRWAATFWPDCPHNIVVEATSNGPDAVLEMKKRLTGVIAEPAKGTKEVRAEAASPALEAGNCFLPGYRLADGSGYDQRTPEAVQNFVESAAVFPYGLHDDDVDAWAGAMNYLRKRGTSKARVAVPRGRM